VRSLGDLLREFPLTAFRIPNHPASYELHRHSGYSEVVVVTHGTGHHLLGDQAFEMQVGDAFVVPPDMLHGYANGKDLGLLNVLFDPTRLPLPENLLLQVPAYAALFHYEPRLRAAHAFESRLRLDTAALERVLETADKLRNEREGMLPGYQAATLAHFCHLVLELSRSYGAMSAPLPKGLVRLSELMQWLERHLPEQHTVDSLAARAAMSRSTFVRAFRSCFGASPMSYVTRLRVEKAARLLRAPGTRVKEVAPLVGIEDASYFSRVFRKQMGVDPRAYRAQFQP
jgi:AraC-like DNA-binding protein